MLVIHALIFSFWSGDLMRAFTCSFQLNPLAVFWKEFDIALFTHVQSYKL